MTKRVRFVLVSTILGSLLMLANLVAVEARLAVMLAVSGIAYVLSVWVLFEDLKGIEWLTLMILPVMFTLGAGLFIGFLPSALPSLLGFRFQIETSLVLAKVMKFIFAILYVLGMYAIYLVENIFSVASIRTIQLLRAARSVGFVMTLVVGLFFYAVTLSLRLEFWWVGIISFFVSWLLAYGDFWSMDLKEENINSVKRFSIIMAWIMGLTGVVMAFWPVRPFMGGLMMVAMFYAHLGILEQKLKHHAYTGTNLEYLVFGLIILLIGYLTTSWRG